jgi:60 kDa SS-A/Ro ribonucleoprotein
VRCIDVAALVAAAICAKNRQTRVLPFERDVVNVKLNPRDSVLTQAQALAAIGGGGTNCSAPLAMLNREKAQVDVVVFVSDNESWVDARRGATQMMAEWEALKKRNPQAKLICLDLQPNTTTQAVERADVMNVGGFSDAVFTAMARFAAGQTSAEHWVGEIDKIALDSQ